MLKLVYKFTKRGIAAILLSVLFMQNHALAADEAVLIHRDAEQQPYRFGIGKADITGPAAENGMLGFGELKQKTAGIHMRQWARAFIIQGQGANAGSPLVYVNTDLQSVSMSVRQGVLAKLKVKYRATDGTALYGENNVMLAATHTHSGPGGFSHYAITNILTLGFQKQTYDAIVEGIVRAVDHAHQNMTEGRLYYGTGKLYGASANRALIPFGLNSLSQEDKDYYKNGVDPQMTVLKFVDSEKKIRGVITWFAVHTTSIGPENHLISSDNKGYAQYYWEHFESRRDPGLYADDFVAAFAQSNPGDISPNLAIPLLDDKGKEVPRSKKELIAFNTCPGVTNPAAWNKPYPNPECQFENARRNGMLQFQTALNIVMGRETAGEKEHPLEEVRGALESRFRYVDFPALRIAKTDADEIPVKPEAKTPLCEAVMGTSFSRGSTEDNPSTEIRKADIENLGGAINFFFSGSLPAELKKCHDTKELWLNTGGKKPYPWTANIVPVQLFQIGQMAVLGGPGEYTVTSALKIRRQVAEVFKNNPTARHDIKHIVLNGYANDYIGYITTRKEYSKDQYEAGHTIFGPGENRAFIELFAGLATDLSKGEKSVSTGTPPDLSAKQLNFQTGVVFDSIYIDPTFDPSKIRFSLIPFLIDTGIRVITHDFGYVLTQPKAKYKRGNIVRTSFVTGHPKNNLRTEGTFLQVLFIPNGKTEKDAQIVATDDDFNTKYEWGRVGIIAGSQATTTWEIPMDAQPGRYFIRHYGDWKELGSGLIREFKGTTNTFKVE
ncbi:neutral/alkaline non-lysosomal ceramidase N-terminal domain-containing protein [Phyllobacterium endophyticum]|uniref:neutral/alkaline non-lysosomal ceramidase N-terminal domain-containing protein n=1 Tax=Phyllobacterium endophyticum TaxID=1149773 RepID=UPI0011C9EC05|nr:neutral/alkaline non-lysosomal ceramidase N-terminal domain-containing protein [Phyllobacterium endophyticum]TXR47566.1 neutral/alkaline ceramidase [Phyllobacterium endophyticum]